MTRKKAAPATSPATEDVINADRRPEPPDPDDLVLVYPVADLPEGSFLAGVGVEGAKVSPELAGEWITAGLATTERPTYAAGGPMRAGANYIVGESGPEIVIPVDPGFIVPAPPAQREV